MSALAPVIDVGETDQFELGWDYGCHRLRPPEDLPAAVLQGYEAARRQTGAQPVDRFVRKWLLVRANALRRGMPCDPALTPRTIRALDTTHCPITGEALTHGTGELSDWSVDRVANDRGYVPGNLVMMSTRANRAKANLATREIIRVAMDEQVTEWNGLDRDAWLRLGELVSMFDLAERGSPPTGVPRLRGNMIYPGLRLAPLAYWQVISAHNAIYDKRGPTLALQLGQGSEKQLRRAAMRLLRDINRRAPRYPAPWLIWQSERLQRSLDAFLVAGGRRAFDLYGRPAAVYFSAGLNEGRRRLEVPRPAPCSVELTRE